MEFTPELRVRWLPCRNAYSGTIPPYAIVEITGYSLRDGVICYDVTRPTNPGEPDRYAINGPQPIQANRRGRLTFDLPFWLAYDAAQGTPALGETWGPQPGSFLARKGPVYFRVLGSPQSGKVVVGQAIPSSYTGKSKGGASIAAMSGSTPGTGTLVVEEFNSAGQLVATTLEIPIVNLSRRQISGTKQLQVKQERRTGRYLIDVEHC